jgi:DNA-directed RNA polymerase subunit RPC12/RpoP
MSLLRKQESSSLYNIMDFRCRGNDNDRSEAVIRFKCIYCGQRILAKEDGAGKKGKCPTCRHDVRVPKTIKDTPAISTDISEREKKAKAKLDLMSALMGPPEDTAELIKEKAGWFIPVYDELSLFLMAITLILLYIINSPMRGQIHKWMITQHSILAYILAAIFLCGLCLSIYHIFTTREKTDIEKWGMLFFAVLANAVTGIIAGVYVIKNTTAHDWLLVFPIWNIVNGALLLLMLRFRIIDEECISDRDATASEVIIGLAAVFVILIFCNYVFKLHWAITFSICIIYATSFDRALQSVFPGLSRSEDEQAV